MLLSAVFERFVEKSPVSVMVEGTLQNALQASLLDCQGTSILTQLGDTNCYAGDR
jgi:hypothetical protein